MRTKSSAIWKTRTRSSSRWRELRVVTVDPLAPDEATLAMAAEVLRAGGLVAFPTETVYGLGARALVAADVRRIFAAKGRPPTNPLIVHVASIEAVDEIAFVEPWVRDLGEALWPGPITFVLPARERVPPEVMAGGSTVAVRIPAHPVALGLLRALGEPVAAPSANRSTEVSPTTAAHVRTSLGAAVDLVLDGGPTPQGIESTVVDLTGETPRILRPGALSRDALERALHGLGRSLLPASSVQEEAGSPARSPGLMDRHYAPRARVRLVPTAGLARALAEGANGDNVKVLSYSALFANGIALPAHPDRYAARLYATLRDLDAGGAEVIVVEEPPHTAAWEAVNDRLRRAAQAVDPL